MFLKNDRSPSSDGVRSSYFNTVRPKYSILECVIDIGRSYVGFSEFGLKVLSALDSGSFWVIYYGNQGFIVQNQVFMKLFSFFVQLLSCWE